MEEFSKPTQLDSIINATKSEPGLRARLPQSEINLGVAAAETLNQLIMKMIGLTGANTDRLITEADMMAISAQTYANPADYMAFLESHGNDNGTVESGFNHFQDDGATMLFRGRNFVDTVADAINHFGFKIQNGPYFNEDGNDNQTARDVAGWLNFFLNGHSVVHGTVGNNMLGSGTCSDYFVAARNETFLAGAGNDRIWSDIGNDTVWTGTGDDEAGGGTGNDIL